jgi:small neutral amino acid transporter SnatA (MarC family)
LGEVLGAAFLLYGQIVAIMNPFTAVNNYITLTQELSIEEARAVLRKSMAVVLFLGLLFIFAGRLILEFYHLSLAALRFGGGILLMYIAVDMLGGSRSPESGGLRLFGLPPSGSSRHGPEPRHRGSPTGLGTQGPPGIRLGAEPYKVWE